MYGDIKPKEILEDENGEKYVKLPKENAHSETEKEKRFYLSKCKVCGGYPTDDPSRYYFHEDICSRGCCHYGWDLVEHRPFSKIPSFGRLCKDCEEEKGVEIARDELLDKIEGIKTNYEDEIKIIEDKIEKLKKKKNKINKKEVEFENDIFKYKELLKTYPKLDYKDALNLEKILENYTDSRGFIWVAYLEELLDYYIKKLGYDTTVEKKEKEGANKGQLGFPF